jgi:raffinose/stachyose/melibiose transport system permease protein
MQHTVITKDNLKPAIPIGKIVSYFIFGLWTFITIIPLIWMFYSSFKSNEEITLNPYSLPYALFDNANDDYIVIRPDLNVTLDYDPVLDTRPRLTIESTTIAPQRRYLVFNLLKESLSSEVAARKVGDHVKVSELPSGTQFKIHWSTVWFNYIASYTKGGLGVKFINSVMYSGVSTFFVVMLGLMIGFALAKLRFPRLSLVIGGTFMFGYFISISSVFIPLYLMLSQFKLTDNPVTIIVVYIAFWLPLAVMLATQFISGLPDSLIESAYIDGATTMKTFRAIILPMCTPVAITIAIVTALQIWNEFLLVQVITSSEKWKSLPVGVFSFSSQTSLQAGWQFAAMVFALLPAMIVYFIFNKRIAQGVVAGAIKG